MPALLSAVPLFRIVLTPVLAYKRGELKILELRQRAEQALGENFDLRQS